VRKKREGGWARPKREERERRGFRFSLFFFQTPFQTFEIELFSKLFKL
jgi:hypothetical protein